MFSLRFKPLNNKPTRITAYSSPLIMLIDNISSNELDFKHKSVVVITDMSDNIPIITSGICIKNLQTNSFKSHQRNMLYKDKLIKELKNTD